MAHFIAIEDKMKNEVDDVTKFVKAEVKEELDTYSSSDSLESDLRLSEQPIKCKGEVRGIMEQLATRMGTESTLNLQSFAPKYFSASKELATVGKRWQNWKRRFEIYLMASGVKEAERKCALFLLLGGPEVQDEFYKFPQDARENANTYTKMFALLDSKFNKPVNRWLERSVFFNTFQKVNETTEEYVCRLEKLAETCAFSNPDERIAEMVLVRGNSLSLSKKLLEVGDKLSLAIICEIARSHELSEQSSKIIEEANARFERYTGLYKSYTPSLSKNYNNNHNKKKGFACFRCGSSNHHPSEKTKCPATGKTCSNCKKKRAF